MMRSWDQDRLCVTPMPSLSVVLLSAAVISTHYCVSLPSESILKYLSCGFLAALLSAKEITNMQPLIGNTIVIAHVSLPEYSGEPQYMFSSDQLAPLKPTPNSTNPQRPRFTAKGKALEARALVLRPLASVNKRLEPSLDLKRSHEPSYSADSIGAVSQRRESTIPP